MAVVRAPGRGHRRRAGRRERRGGDARGQREEPVLPDARAARVAGGQVVAGLVPLPHQGAGAGPAHRPARTRAAAARTRPSRLRRRYPTRRARRHPPLGARAADQPGHAARGHPAEPQGLGRLPAAAEHRRHRRGAHVPRRLRLACLAAAAPAAARVRPLRRGAALHPVLGHHRQSGGAGRKPGLRAVHRRHRERRTPRREAFPVLEPAPSRRRAGRPGEGLRGVGAAAGGDDAGRGAHHRLRADAADGGAGLRRGAGHGG